MSRTQQSLVGVLELKPEKQSTKCPVNIPNDVTLIEKAIRVNPRDSREYAGNQQDSPLYDMCDNPANYSNIRYHDSEIVIVDDRFAKSPNHVLLMPRDTSLNEIADLATKDLPLLYRFRDQAKIEISRMLELDPGRIPMFMVGFHVIPSLFPLHCHLLDWSFSTGNAYHPRHWKVQFSNMFITLDKVIEEIEQTGHMVIDVDAYWHDWQTKPIRCPVCPGPQPQWEGDINALVSHWAAHIHKWKLTKTLPPNVGSYRQWEPTYPVLLTTRKCAPSIGLDNELDHVKRDFPSLEIHRYFSHEWASIPKYILDKTTIYFQTTELPPDGVRLPRLRWIQLFSSGADQLTHSPYNHYPNLCVTCTKGAGSVAIAEWVVMCTLLLTRNMLTALHHQAYHQWQPAPLMGLRTLSQLSIGIIGYGHVGQQTAERFLALGAKKVTAVKRHGFTRSLATPSSRLNGVTVRRLDSKAALHEFLRGTDVLILAAPLSVETRGLVGAAELAVLPRGAVVLNISRGPLLDERALSDALRSGKLGGAALDVVTEEPLGAGSELWDLPNVIITPHISTMHDQYNQNVVNNFEENLRAYLKNRPMKNTVALPLPAEKTL